MLQLIVTGLVLVTITAGVFAFGVGVGVLLGHSARTRLRYAQTNLLTQIDSLQRQVAITVNGIDNLRNEHCGVLDIAGRLSQTNVRLTEYLTGQPINQPGAMPQGTTPPQPVEELFKDGDVIDG